MDYQALANPKSPYPDLANPARPETSNSDKVAPESKLLMTILFVTIIPSEAVEFFGQVFNGGVKSTLKVSVDLTKSGLQSMQLGDLTWDETIEYNWGDALPVVGAPSWFRHLRSGAKKIARERLKVSDTNLKCTWSPMSGASHGVRLVVDGPNPLVSAAPAINAEISVGFRKTGRDWEYSITGNHDGFPSYIVGLNGTAKYTHDCVAANQTPWSLFPPMEYDVAVDWSKV